MLLQFEQSDEKPFSFSNEKILSTIPIIITKTDKETQELETKISITCEFVDNIARLWLSVEADSRTVIKGRISMKGLSSILILKQNIDLYEEIKIIVY
jgi:hypothetical protein